MIYNSTKLKHDKNQWYRDALVRKSNLFICLPPMTILTYGNIQI